MSRIEAQLTDIQGRLAAAEESWVWARRLLLGMALLAFVAAVVLGILARTEPLAGVSLAALFIALAIVALVVYGKSQK
ncbi:MAG: hypothetical protein HY328_05450 [Chloroflexi bacterium]|nr:hypothetical protein [Chloroflexota bacterium]